MLSSLMRVVLITVKLGRIRFKPRIGKRLRRMAKRPKRRGKSVRNGNSPAPYTKYKKKPYKYTFTGAYTKVGGGGADNKYAPLASKGY